MTLLVFTLLFGPRIFGTAVDIITIASLIILVFFSLSKGFISRNVILATFLIILLNLPLLVFGTTSQVPEKHLLKPIRLVIEFLGACILVSYFYKLFREDYIHELGKSLYLCILIHSYIIIAQFLSADFRNLIYLLTGAIEAGLLNVDGTIDRGERVAGLTYGQSLLSVIQGFGALFLWEIRKRPERNKYLYWRYNYLIIVASLLLTGKAGFLVAVFGLMFLSIVKVENNFKPILIFITGFIISLFILTWVYTSLCSFVTCSESVSRLLYRLDEIYTILYQGQSYTLAKILGELELPSGQNFIIGGQLTTIDSGYYKDIYLGGVFYSICILAFLIFSVGICTRSLYFDIISPAFYLIIIIVIVFHFKESAIFSRGIWFLFSIPLAMSLITKTKNG